MKHKTSWILGVVALGAMVLYLAAFQVPEGHAAVVTRFGRPVSVVAEAGLHLKAPAPIERASLVDRRVNLLQPPGLELLTADKRNIVVEVFVLYQVEDTMRFVRAVGTKATAEAHLVDLVVAHLGAQVGQRAFTTFLGEEQAAPEIAEQVAASVDQTAREDLGITIVRLGFRRIIFPTQNVAAVIRRMQAEREKIARGYRGEGKERALSIEAETEKERGRIVATAKEEALKIRADADAEAARIYAEAQGAEPDLYRFLKTLEVSEAVLKENTTLLMPYDSELLSPLLQGK